MNQQNILLHFKNVLFITALPFPKETQESMQHTNRLTFILEDMDWIEEREFGPRFIRKFCDLSVKHCSLHHLALNNIQYADTVHLNNCFRSRRTETDSNNFHLFLQWETISFLQRYFLLKQQS